MRRIELLKIQVKAVMQEGQTEEAKEQQRRILITTCQLMRGLGNLMKPAGLVMLCMISLVFFVTVAAGQIGSLTPALAPVLMLTIVYPIGFLFEMVGETGLILLEKREYPERRWISNGWAGGRNYR